MRYANLPLLQVCVIFFLGIWFGFTDLALSFSAYSIFSLSLLVLFIALFFLTNSFPKLKLFFTGIAVLLIFSLGIINTKIHLPKFQEHHYTQVIAKDSINNKYVSFEGKLLKSLKSNAFKNKYEVELHTLQGNPVEGKVLFQVPKTSDAKKLSSHSKLVGYGKIKSFSNPLNPQQFNYKEYMMTQQMSHVIDSDVSQFKLEEQIGFSFSNFGDQARSKIQLSLDKYNFTAEQMSLLQALLLGQKQDIDPDTYTKFSKAGVVHILAVSGLHVGIILVMLQFITQPILRLTYGRSLRSFIILIGIWGFASLAGFSPSVLRASVMFSFLSFAINSRRKTSAINTLAMSAVFLLMINPYYIQQVGFQLSYLAVVSIVTLQPRLSKLFEPKTKFQQKTWDIITVTISAQLGVLPLSIYYFHQFPGLFLLSNLIILPCLGALLYGGILIILLSLLGILPDILAFLYGKLLDFLLGFVDHVASLDNLVFTDIYFTKPMFVTSLIFLLSLILWSSKRKFFSYSMLNLSLLAFMICTHLEKRKQLQQEEVLVFQSYRNSEMGVLKGSYLNLFSDTIQNKDSILNSYHIKNYKTLRGVDSIALNTFRAVYQLNSKATLYVLDSVPMYPKENFNPDYLLLKNSPDINLDRALETMQPKQIIADGSNYKSDIDLWRSSANKLNINFHSTWEDGAFIFPEN